MYNLTIFSTNCMFVHFIYLTTLLCVVVYVYYNCLKLLLFLHTYKANKTPQLTSEFLKYVFKTLIKSTSRLKNTIINFIINYSIIKILSFHNYPQFSLTLPENPHVILKDDDVETKHVSNTNCKLSNKKNVFKTDGLFLFFIY